MLHVNQRLAVFENMVGVTEHLREFNSVGVAFRLQGRHENQGDVSTVTGQVHPTYGGRS